MKKMIAITVAVLFACIMANAQNWSYGISAGTLRIRSDVNYEQLFLKDNDALSSSWGIGPSVGADYYILDNIYVGSSIGLSDNTVKYDFGSYGSSTSSIYDIRIPIRAGVSMFGSILDIETGPFVSLTAGGSTNYTYKRETTTTKIKDMDVSRSALGWSINAKLFGFVNIGYSFMLTESVFGDGGEFGFLSVGLSYTLPLGGSR